MAVTGRIFDGLSDPDRLAIIAAAKPRVLQAREPLASQGDPATTFYLVEVGYLKLTKVGADGREVIARFLGPGEPFAAIVLLDMPEYPVSAVAVEPTRVIGWAADVVRGLASRHPRFRANVVGEVAQHMTDALDRVQELTSERVSQRLARTLLRLADHGSRRPDGGVEIPHPITRQDLADLTGATLFTVSRLLARWEAGGIVASRRGRVAVLRRADIESLVER